MYRSCKTQAKCTTILDQYAKHCHTCLAPDLLCILDTFCASLDRFEMCLEKEAEIKEVLKFTRFINDVCQNIITNYRPNVGSVEQDAPNLSVCSTVINMVHLLPGLVLNGLNLRQSF